MVKLFQIILVTLVTACCGEQQQQQFQHSSTTESPSSASESSSSLPSTSRVYFHQAFSRTTSGTNEEPTTLSVQQSKVYPSSIQAVNRSLEDAALKMSETQHLLGYEPETWNNRYSPPIPLDVLASETDEDEHDNDERIDDDDGDNDSDESHDDGQTHDNGHNHNSDDQRDDEGDAPEQDGEVTEEYNDENAQKVIDEIDGDINGQEGQGQNDDFTFAATVQRPAIVKPDQDADKQKRCKTIYREVNGFAPHSKLLSDDEDFDFHWRRKRSINPKPETPKGHGPIGTGQAQSSSYMITRECTFDDEEEDSVDEPADTADPVYKPNNAANAFNTITGKTLSSSDVEKPGIASSSSWSVRSPPLLSRSQPSSRNGQTTGSRSESRFIPIFGWKKHKFITEEETPVYETGGYEMPGYSHSMSNDFETESNTFRPMNNDFGSHGGNDFWLQPGAQPWNEWNHFSGPNSGAHGTAGDDAHEHNNVDEDDGGTGWSGPGIVGNNHNGNGPNDANDDGPEHMNPNTESESHSSVPFESYFEWSSPKGFNKKIPHSDDGEDDVDGQQEDEHSDDSVDDDGLNVEDDSARMDHSPPESGAGSVRRMFTQHIRQRRSIQSYSSTLNNANFAWTQPAKNARAQLQHDTPYTWNYFQQEHPHKHDEEESNAAEEQNTGQFERKPVHEEGADVSDDDEGVSGENHDNNDNDESSSGVSSSADPDNYSNSYNGGNQEEYNIDYDSDRLSDNGAGYNGGKQNDENTMDDEDEYEKF